MSVRALLFLLDAGKGANLFVFIGLIGHLGYIGRVMGDFGLGIIAVAKNYQCCKK